MFAFAIAILAGHALYTLWRGYAARGRGYYTFSVLAGLLLRGRSVSAETLIGAGFVQLGGAAVAALIALLDRTIMRTGFYVGVGIHVSASLALVVVASRDLPEQIARRREALQADVFGPPNPGDAGAELPDDAAAEPEDDAGAEFSDEGARRARARAAARRRKRNARRGTDGPR